MIYSFLVNFDFDWCSGEGKYLEHLLDFLEVLGGIPKNVDENSDAWKRIKNGIRLIWILVISV